MRVLLIGSGGREHAMAWKLIQSQKITELIVAPGNAGTAELGENVPVMADDLDGLLAIAKTRSIDLTVVGPEQPLIDGISELFQRHGLKIFGPSKNAARIEGSKIWSNDLMVKYAIPTADSVAFSESTKAIDYALARPEGSLVVKADGPAAGKGVLLPDTYEDLEIAVRGMLDGASFGESSSSLLLAERMSGPEVSVFAFLDGETVSAEIAACDYKRIGEGDTGLNTGGVGAYAPPEFWTNELAARVRMEILEPTARALVAENSAYSGVLYVGLMITSSGPRVIEFNCRLGDPECQVLMPKLVNDFLEICLAVADGRLAQQKVIWSDLACTFVVMTSDGYPGNYETGATITGVHQASEHGLVVHAGTSRQNDGALVTDGGRVLGVVGSGETIGGSRVAAYAGIEKIFFRGARFRRDIAERAV